MRVAMVCPYSLDVPGGVGTHVLGLAAWLTGAGHEVRVIAPGTRPPLPGPAFEVALLGGAVPLPFNGSTARLALGPRQARRARHLVAGADVVHVHEPLTPGIAFVAARAARTLVVTHHASFKVPAGAGVLLRPVARLLGRRVTVAVSAAAASTALAVTGVRATIIPNGIDLPTPRGPRPDGPLRIGFLGRIDEPRKGFRIFREAAALTADDGRFEFVAAGPGTGTGTEDPGGPVHMLGEVPDRWAFLRSIDVLVAPNLGGESFGLVGVEALAAGCDVVASDLAAFTAVLDEAGVGRTFPTGDVTTLVASLRRLPTDPIDPGIARAAAGTWDWDNVGPRILGAYRRASSLLP